jgi:hypothetical protein
VYVHMRNISTGNATSSKSPPSKRPPSKRRNTRFAPFPLPISHPRLPHTQGQSRHPIAVHRRLPRPPKTLAIVLISRHLHYPARCSQLLMDTRTTRRPAHFCLAHAALSYIRTDSEKQRACGPRDHVAATAQRLRRTVGLVKYAPRWMQFARSVFSRVVRRPWMEAASRSRGVHFVQCVGKCDQRTDTD